MSISQLGNLHRQGFHLLDPTTSFIALTGPNCLIIKRLR